jgi:hypothetical protein
MMRTPPSTSSVVTDEAVAFATVRQAPGYLKRIFNPTLRPAEFTPDGLHNLFWLQRQPKVYQVGCSCGWTASRRKERAAIRYANDHIWRMLHPHIAGFIEWCNEVLPYTHGIRA